jgi:hypothetical protein
MGCGWATLLAEHDLLIHTNYHEIDDLVSSYFVLISSPDGQQIAFASAEGGHPNIYVIRAEGGRPRRLTAENFQRYLAQLVARWTVDLLRI